VVEVPKRRIHRDQSSTLKPPFSTKPDRYFLEHVDHLQYCRIRCSQEAQIGVIKSSRRVRPIQPQPRRSLRFFRLLRFCLLLSCACVHLCAPKEGSPHTHTPCTHRNLLITLFTGHTLFFCFFQVRREEAQGEHMGLERKQKQREGAPWPLIPRDSLLNKLNKKKEDERPLSSSYRLASQSQPSPFSLVVLFV
jgi:hypothetical protein